MKLIENCKSVYPFFKDVVINHDSLQKCIANLREQEIPLPTWKEEFCYRGDAERTMDWIFLFNAINFCYWNTPRWHTTIQGKAWGQDDEAFGVMAALAHTMHNGVPMQDHNYLASIELSDISAIFAGADKAGSLPLLKERREGWIEMGMAFQRFGNAAGMIRMAEQSAPKLAAFLVASCPSWSDIQYYNDIPLPFHKRAWLCTAMLYERFIDDIDRRLTDSEHIPVFADYRLPQALRALGILEYSTELAAIVDQQMELAEDSTKEIEIRACTILVAQMMHADLPDLSPLHIDAYLWTYAVQQDLHIAPHHRTRTTRY